MLKQSNAVLRATLRSICILVNGYNTIASNDKLLKTC